MDKTKRCTKFLTQAFIFMAAIISLLALSGFSPLWAADAVLLVDKHKAAGIECDGCHKEAPPAQKVASSICMSCHGNYSALAEQTEKANPNPHDSHLGQLPCEQCHRVHKTSVNACARCHDRVFILKVP